MAKKGNKRINVVARDSSTVFDKKQQLQSLGYFDKNIWERTQTVDVLDKDRDYLDMVAKDKQYCDFVRGYSRFGRTIESTIYTDLGVNELLFATVAHRKGNIADLTANQQVINSSSSFENSVFSSVISNNAPPVIETGKGGVQVPAIQSIQLFRYDATGDWPHENIQEIYDYYKMNYGEPIANLYKSFFTEKVDFPHFHFMNRTMSEEYCKTSEGNAISLDKLIDYIEQLMRAKKNQPLNHFDFGMPFLDIKNNPNKYRSAIDVKNLSVALVNNNVNKQIDSIFKQTNKLQPNMVVLTGLEAVYSDLVLLRILRGTPPTSGAIIQPPSGTGPTPNGGTGGAPSGGQPYGNGLNLGSGSSGLINKFMSYIKYSKNRQNNGSQNSNDRNPERETSRYEVSTAELQLASKVATGDSMTLLNSHGRERMHFEEADPNVDDTAYEMLHNLLYICENFKYKGGGNGPIL